MKESQNLAWVTNNLCLVLLMWFFLATLLLLRYLYPPVYNGECRKIIQNNGITETNRQAYHRCRTSTGPPSPQGGGSEEVSDKAHNHTN